MFLLALAGCVRESLEPVEEIKRENKVHITLNTEVPETKVTFGDADQLIWEAMDSVTLLIGDDSSRKTRAEGNNSIAAKLTAAGEGVFEGIVDLGEFSRDSIQAAIYPYNAEHHYRRSVDGDGDTYRICMMVGGKKDKKGNFTQVQKSNNVLHGENITLYSCIKTDYMKDHPNQSFKYGGNYLLDDVKFEWGSSLIRFNIYGKYPQMDSTEVFKSLVLHPKMANLAGIQEYINGHVVAQGKPSRAGVYTIGETTSAENTITVSLDEPLTIADKTQEDGIKVFMSLIPRGEITFPAEASVRVYTDRWFYSVPLEGITVNLERGKVRMIALDMSKATSPEKTYYQTTAIDSTGVEVAGQWTDVLPSGPFTKLAVKGGLREETLLQIADLLSSMDPAVDLDLSESEYETAEFPNFFAGTTVNDKYEGLKSIKFPHNIVKIADNAFAYCGDLESVDLSTVKEIGATVFQYSGLKTVTVPSNITYIGNGAFQYLEHLKEVYYNPVIDWTGYTASELADVFRTFNNRNKTWGNKVWNNSSKEMKFTVGPNVTKLTGYFFDTNAMLTDLTIEANNIDLVFQWAIRAFNIRRIEFKGSVPAATSGGLGTGFADELNDYEGSIIVPEGKLMEFADNAVILGILGTGKYMIRESGKEDDVQDVDYLTDDNTEWSKTIPSRFEKLYVKTSGDNYIGISELISIKNAISAQSNPVELDMSQATYMSSTFSSLLKGVVKLKSIKFPSNVTAIAEAAFANCTELREVDLTGITKIDRQAFRYSGLKTLNIPSSVDTIGNEAFAYLKDVESIYYNATPSGHYTSGTTGYKILCNRDKEWTNSDWNNRERPVTITIGPDVKEIPAYFFDTNARLTTLIIEAGTGIKFWDQWAIRAFNIERIEFKGDAPTCEALGQGANFAAQLTDKEGVIVCPVGRYDEFAASAFVQNILGSGKYRLRELGDEDNMVDPVTVVEYSADNSTWSETIPASFSTLYVKTSDGSLTATHMDEIKAAVDAQSGPVTLDMSAAKYVSKAFPETFTATADAPDTKLTAIKFPYNVEEISANAFKYYTALESIDLSQIKVIGGVAFQYSGLKTVTIPANVTKIGSMAFSYLKNLTEVYYNPTIDWSQYTVQDITNNNRHLSNRSTDWSNADWNNSDNPTKITFGPNVTLVTGYFFDSNAKVTELIVEGDNLQFVWQWAIRARNIKRIEFKGVLPTWSNHHSPGMGGDFATELGEKEGVIVVPDKYLVEAFENDVVKSLLNTGKYRLRQASNEFDVNDPVLPSAKLEYSVDGLSYTSTIPASFSTLYVKDLTSEFMDAEQLTPIKTAIDAQSEPVSLDLSGVRYEATSFPAIFAGTADAPYTKLKSIKFPSNVNEVEAKAFAYCSALESADLAQITSYGDECFRNTGLKSLRLDNNVKRLGSKAFYNCFNLAEVYYNPTDSRLDNWGETNRVNYYSFAFEDGYRENHTTDLVFTVGPDTRLGRYMLDGNANLTEVIFYNGNRQHQQSIRNVHYLSSVVIKNAEGLIHYKGGSGFVPLGDMVDASVTKTVTVPKGCLAKYTENTRNADDSKNDNCEFYEAFTGQGFTFVEATE